MGKELEIRIKPNGEMHMETFGTHGAECTNIMNNVLQYVGGVIDDEHKKDEYYTRDNNVYTRT
jgi:hypothetical protein